jgi:toxin CcdB
VRQFEAYQNPVPAARAAAPFLVMLSSHHLPDLTEVVVAPAVSDALRIVGDLEIGVTIVDRPTVLLVSELFSVRAQTLRRSVGSLAAHEDEIRRALDRLFSGF